MNGEAMEFKLVVAGLSVVVIAAQVIGKYFKRATERHIMKRCALDNEMQTIYRFRRD